MRVAVVLVVCAVLMVGLIFAITILGDRVHKEQVQRVQSGQLEYLMDPTTDLCFVRSANTDGAVLSYVPCSEKVLAKIQK